MQTVIMSFARGMTYELPINDLFVFPVQVLPGTKTISINLQS